MIETSEKVDMILPKLLDAMKEMPNPKMTGRGVFGDYATVGDILDASKKILLDNDLIVMQSAYRGGGGLVIVDTHIYHSSSSQYIASKGWANQPDGKNPLFAGGSALTYGRRQALAAMLQLVGEEDPEETESLDRDEVIKQIDSYIAGHSNPDRQKKIMLATYKVETLEEMTDDDLGRALNACESAK